MNHQQGSQKKKQDEPKPASPKPTEPVVVSPTNTDNQYGTNRIAAVEANLSKLDDRIWNWQSNFVAILFGAVSLFLAYSNHESRVDLKDAIMNMETRVQKAIGEIEKRPALQILTEEGKPLDGKTFFIPFAREGRFGPVFLKNTGHRRTDPLSVRITSSCQLVFGAFGPISTETPTLETNRFAYVFEFHGTSIVPDGGEFPAWDGNQNVSMGLETNAACRMRVDYGGDTPAIAEFYIKAKK